MHWSYIKWREYFDGVLIRNVLNEFSTNEHGFWMCTVLNFHLRYLLRDFAPSQAFLSFGLRWWIVVYKTKSSLLMKNLFHGTSIMIGKHTSIMIGTYIPP